MRRAVLVATLLLHGAFPRVAFAGDVAKARKVFAEGVKLYQSGDWEGARRLFREAETEHHAPAIVYNIGLAEEKLGHPQAAVDAYEAYVREVGEKGDLAPAAVAAIVQIKARSTQLRIESRPPGARAIVDGALVPEATPTTLLVAGGHHLVRAEGNEGTGWRAEKEIEARGAGDTMTVLLEPASAPTPPAPPPSPAAPEASSPGSGSPSPSPLPPQHADGDRSAAAGPLEPDGIVWSAGFAVAPIYLVGVSTPGATNSAKALSILAGPELGFGLALNERLEFFARGFVGIGPDAKPSYGFYGGPGLSYHVLPALWLGGTFIGGQIETRAKNFRYGTDLVFGGSIEASLVVLKKREGEWLATLSPSFLLTEMRQDNTALYVPLSFGYRSF